jgi:hypothetical protein
MLRELIDLPPEMARLPRDHRGYPVPEFVAWFDGLPDFRVLKPGYRETCYRQNRCWLCGGQMGKRKWFVIGPMCSITRTTMEPPSHRLCAEFAVKNCPFLTKPMAKRNERDLPEESHVDGTMIDRNPGVSMIWETLSYEPFEVDNGWLITVGDPTDVTAWREGRKASREELLDSVISGLPILMAEAKKQGDQAEREFLRTLRLWGKKVLERWFPEQRKAS